MNMNIDMGKTVVILVILLIVGLSTSMYVETFTSEVHLVESEYDKRSYLVRNLPDKDKAARLLSLLRARLMRFVVILKHKYPTDARIQRLKANYNPDAISESLPSSKYTSYSVNKGERIVFCIRQRDDTDSLVDLNTMMFVAIHELSHLMTLSIGHTKEFWENMKFLLKEAMAKDVQLYSYQPFHQKPEKYCKTLITDTPLKLD